MTPLQLLYLSREERELVNSKHKPKALGSGVSLGLKDLVVGNTVRVLLMNRKEQIKGGLGGRFKGFAPKWSSQTYFVLKRRAMRRNPGVFTYRLNRGSQNFYRHELLFIPGGRVDRDVPQGYVQHKQRVIAPAEAAFEEDYPSDDSRAASD